MADGRPIRLTPAQKKPVGELYPGDNVEVSITSVVKINRDDNWIRMSAISAVRADETGQQAHERLLAYVQDRFKQTVQSTVEMIEEMDQS